MRAHRTTPRQVLSDKAIAALRPGESQQCRAPAAADHRQARHMTMKTSRRHRLQGMAAALAELIRLHGCETEALNVLQGFGVTLADLLTAGADPMDLAELTALEAVRAAERIQLRRTKGWRMPANAVKVDRSTRWGNPFIVGEDGTPAECVELYRRLLAGGICATTSAPIERQVAARDYVRQHIEQLRGHDLACWCRPGAPCHAEVLLKLANQASSTTRETPNAKL